MSKIHEKIKEATDLIDFLEPWVEVNRHGMAQCPFHNDDSPSLRVYRDGAWCHACNKTYDIFNFAERFMNLDSKGALKYLCSLTGIHKEGVPQGESFDFETTLTDAEILLNYFSDQLFTSSGQTERNYLTSRGFSLTQMRAVGFGKVTMEVAGVAENAFDYKDRARSGYTLAIPRYNHKGEVVSFKYRKPRPGGKLPYLNPSGKSPIDMAFYIPKDSAKEFIVFTEAEMDALLFMAWGVPAAAPGSLNIKQEHILNAFSKLGYQNVGLMLDKDQAGHRVQDSLASGLIGHRGFFELAPTGAQKDLTEWANSDPTLSRTLIGYIRKTINDYNDLRDVIKSFRTIIRL